MHRGEPLEPRHRADHCPVRDTGARDTGAHDTGARGIGAACAAALLLFALSAPALAGPREQARRIHDRLAGVPPTEAVLSQMEDLIDPPSGGSSDPVGAAYLAMDNPAFYNVVLKDFATPWTNQEQTVYADLNDFSATVIGMIRDDVPFDQVLHGDILYRGTGNPGYSPANNDHYVELQEDRADLSDRAVLIRTTQSAENNEIPAASTAGVITTRAAGEAFFSAGTNRRMWRFTAVNFLCMDMEELKDITRPADRIRQDVTRSPGGDSRIFQQHCVGCHSGMDPMAGAYAYFEWDEDQGRVIHTQGMVQPKHLINGSTASYGFVTTDDYWINYWRAGQNASLGWDTDKSSSGFGPKSLGVEVAASRQFAVCQVRKAFEHVCFRPPGSQADADAISDIADDFEDPDEYDYSMKAVFADVAVYCMGS